MTDIRQKITAKLNAAFKPSHLEIIDNSAAHASHKHHSLNQTSHITIVMSSAEFANKTKLEQHKMVNKAIEEEIAQIHAISLQLKAE